MTASAAGLRRTLLTPWRCWAKSRVSLPPLARLSDYRAWLEKFGVNTEFARVVPGKFTASFLQLLTG